MQLFTQFPDGSYRAHSATITADVRIGELSNFWFNAVVRGDVAPITIGRRVNVQDNAVIHCDKDIPNVIEDDVSIGHGAIVHGKFVGRGSLVGMAATLLSRTVVGSECLIGAGTVLAPDTIVPDRHVVMGVPGKIIRPIKDEELAYLRRITTHYVDLARKYLTGAFGEQSKPG
jgi:gamma-carbonic anhydrase